MLLIQQEAFWEVVWWTLFWGAIALVAVLRFAERLEGADLPDPPKPEPETGEVDLREQERQREAAERERDLREWTLEYLLAKEESTGRTKSRRALRLRRRLAELNEERGGPAATKTTSDPRGITEH